MSCKHQNPRDYMLVCPHVLAGAVPDFISRPNDHDGGNAFCRMCADKCLDEGDLTDDLVGKCEIMHRDVIAARLKKP